MTDYSEEFDRLRRNRVELSHIKYGSARINFGGGRVDALKTAEDCLYPGEHFRATDSSESVKPVGIPINMEETPCCG